MPISKSAKKALRVATRKTDVNRRRKATLKAALKTVSTETLSKTVSVIDKAAKWGIIEPNKAARLKSRLSKTVESKASDVKAPKAAKASSAPKSKAKTSKKAK